MLWSKPFSAGLASALFSALFLTACGSRCPNDANTIKIVSSMPRTGASKGLTDSITNGMKMAFEEVNYKVGAFNLCYDDLDDAMPDATSRS